MSDLHLSISGKDADVAAAADELRAILTDGEEDVAVPQIQPAALPEEARRIIDPVSLAGVILAVPGAVLAVIDVVERLQKRRKAQALVSAAKRLGTERQVLVEVVAADGSWHALDQLTADNVIELADALKRAAPADR